MVKEALAPRTILVGGISGIKFDKLPPFKFVWQEVVFSRSSISSAGRFRKSYSGEIIGSNVVLKLWGKLVL